MSQPRMRTRWSGGRHDRRTASTLLAALIMASGVASARPGRANVARSADRAAPVRAAEAVAPSAANRARIGSGMGAGLMGPGRVATRRPGPGIGIGFIGMQPRQPVIMRPPIVRPGLRPTTGTPRVRSVSTLVNGPLAPLVVRRVVGASLVQVGECYQVGLSRSPSLTGDVQIRFVIGPSGTVDATTVMSTTLADPDTAQCVALTARGFAFPAPAGGRSVVVTNRYQMRRG